MTVVVGAGHYCDVDVVVREHLLGQDGTGQEVAGCGAEEVAVVVDVGEFCGGVGAGALDDLGTGDGVVDGLGHTGGRGTDDGVGSVGDQVVGCLVGLSGVAGLVGLGDVGDLGAQDAAGLVDLGDRVLGGCDLGWAEEGEVACLGVEDTEVEFVAGGVAVASATFPVATGGQAQGEGCGRSSEAEKGLLACHDRGHSVQLAKAPALCQGRADVAWGTSLYRLDVVQLDQRRQRSLITEFWCREVCTDRLVPTRFCDVMKLWSYR